MIKDNDGLNHKYPAWERLKNHYRKVKQLHLRELFAEDSLRGEQMAVEAIGIYYDYSKHRVTNETLQLFWQLAEESGLRTYIDSMFRGEKINITEDRAALHIALRTPKGKSIMID